MIDSRQEIKIKALILKTNVPLRLLQLILKEKKPHMFDVLIVTGFDELVVFL